MYDCVRKYSICTILTFTVSIYSNLAEQKVEVNPICVVYVQQLGSSEWVEYCSTNTIWNDPDPNFETKIAMPFQFGEKQPLKFEIYDYSFMGSNWKENSLGYVICNLAQIIRDAGSGKVRSISSIFRH